MSLEAVVQAVVNAHVGSTFPACAVCVVKGEAVLLDAAWGAIDAETRQIAATTETLFDLASLTKLFTTSAFLSLLCQSHLNIDDALVRLVPEFGRHAPRPIDGGQDPHSKQHLTTPPAFVGHTVDPHQVTFRHLLTHTSGLPPWRDVYNAAGTPPLPPGEADPESRIVRWARAFQTLVTYPFVAPPNGIVRYSDIGLMLLGEATARLHPTHDLQSAIDDVVLSHLHAGRITFNPLRSLHLPLSQIAPTEDDTLWRKRRVWGEVHDENACGVGGVAGHAGLFGTARAVAALGARWLNDAQPFGIERTLAALAITQQAQTNSTRRGLGWALKAAEDSMAGDKLSMQSFGHSGFTGTTLWIDPQAQLVVAALTNSVYNGRHSPDYERTHDFRRALHDAIAEACGR
jgi:CubicO group peptidase (beta-lactamase class C family)